MNYLAHIFLSGDDAARITGNFMGDFVKGKQWREYPEGIQQGILLHRRIDEYTDAHPLVHQSMARIRPILGRFSGIVVDVFYDYCLAQHFADFTEVPLAQFAQNSYRILEEHYALLPEKVQELLPYMRREDWLTHYAHLHGITRALQGVSRRLKNVIDLTLALPTFEAHYKDFEQDFLAFFPQIQEAVKEWIERERE